MARRGKHGCSCIYSRESRTLTFVVCMFESSTNRGFRFIVTRGWSLGAEGESVRVGNRCDGLGEGTRRDSQTERSVRRAQRMSDSEFHTARFDS